MCHSAVACVRVHGTWHRLTPIAQRREEELAGEKTYLAPRRVRGCQGVAPETGTAGGIDLAEATADGPKIQQLLGFEDSALCQPFGDVAEEFHLFDDGLRLQLTLAQPGKLIVGVGCDESHQPHRQGA